MHELGILIEIVKTVENFAKRNGITQIDTLILQIGELSPVVPRYIQDCYPAAIDGTLLEYTKLRIEMIPGNGICKQCSKVFNILENHKKCPKCGSNHWEILCGREFKIKEIIAC
ncbi:hydrogenase maturation nickel metallochaperone HypA/HybF [Aminipila terrae]|uniref:Hydrogenase maturation factor HypA n=1 Tax=Aminipila terrae TaxID=2697030 RepID=A0A6P1MA08_9FIRM|nr:hydrogenase maturation nickel metallochaperone HypA [Aminipila terrae]QHI71539.1 hydrogenase maturation nickel metallochaperone HypA [Aminipila terrae]